MLCYLFELAGACYITPRFAAHGGVRCQWCVDGMFAFKSWIIIDFGYYDGFVFFYRYFAFTTHPAGQIW